MKNKDNLYAIVDAATTPALFDKLQQYDPPVGCLYSEPMDDEIRKLAPYLLLIEDEALHHWLTTNPAPWGCFVTSAASLKALRRHFRKYLRVMLPDEAVPALFRFYDPRNIWQLCEVLNDWQLHKLLGSVVELSTVYEGQPRRDDFASRRNDFPAANSSPDSILKISQAQLDAMDERFTRRYAASIGAHMRSFMADDIAQQRSEIHPVYTLHHDDAGVAEDEDSDNLNSNLQAFATALVSYLKRQDIVDDRLIKGIAQLCIVRGVTQFEGLPQAWKGIIENTAGPGYYRAEKLLLGELGKIPA